MENSTQPELNQIVLDLINLIEKLPNDQELGEQIRIKYWSQLREIKKSL